MARKNKPGLDYFPFDVDFFEDDKVELVSSEFGAMGEIITIRLLCRIYRNGYYCSWGKDENLLFAKRVGNGVTGALVDEVVKGLFRRSFFHKGVFDRFAILTSKGIQTRYIDAKERAKKVEFFQEYTLIDNDVLNKWNNAVIKSINGHINSQSKGEEIREEEIRGERPPPAAPEDNTVIYDVEQYLLNNQIVFEEVCVAAKKNADTAKNSLTKYHLWNQQKELYPKSKQSLVSGFKLWLMNEKESNGTHQQLPAGRKGTSEARVDALKDWGLAPGE
jgi:hypothetical protein